MNAIIERFLTAQFEERLNMIKVDDLATPLCNHLGTEVFSEYQDLARALDTSHLAADEPANVVVLPGVMGSCLASRGLGGVWWLDILNRGHIGDLKLAANGTTDDNPAADIAPVSVMGAYEGLLMGIYRTPDLRHLALPYDWRKPLRVSAAQIRDAVVGAADRNGGPVHVIAHSMGGLAIRTALMIDPSLWEHVDRIVFIATPHYGSPAIAGYLKNHLWGFESLALLGKYLSRQAFRSLRGVLNLLPAPSDVYPGAVGGGHPCTNFDFYQAEEWCLDMNDEEHRGLQAALDETATLHRDLHNWHNHLAPEFRDRMAAVVGVGTKTLFRIAYHRGIGFHWSQMDRVVRRVPGDPNREGDGRVPLASAALAEIGDVRYVRGEHGKLPTIPIVYEDAFRFLRGAEMQLPRSVNQALDRGHLGGDEAESATPALASGGAKQADDDPGYLKQDLFDCDALDDELAASRMPEFTQVRLL